MSLVVKNKEDVQALGIQNGDYIAYDPKTEITESGFIKSRFLMIKYLSLFYLECLSI